MTGEGECRHSSSFFWCFFFFSKADPASRGIEHMLIIQCSFFFFFFQLREKEHLLSWFHPQQGPSPKHDYLIYHQKQSQGMYFLGYSVHHSGTQVLCVCSCPSYILKHHFLEGEDCSFCVIPYRLGPCHACLLCNHL